MSIYQPSSYIPSRQKHLEDKSKVITSFSSTTTEIYSIQCTSFKNTHGGGIIFVYELNCDYLFNYMWKLSHETMILASYYRESRRRFLVILEELNPYY